MTGPAEVTVVVPTHNRRRLVLRTLDSVVRQQDVDLRVVVVVDGGNDGTADAVRRDHPRTVEVVEHVSSRGVSAARNAGLERVDTPWVAFVDDDDLWAPGKLRAQLAALDGWPEASWSCAGALHVDSSVTVTDIDAVPASGDVSDLLLERQVIPGGGSGVLVDTALARRIGGFDERMSILADWDFYLRLGLESPVAAVDEYLVAYYVHQDSMFHDPRGILRELTYMQDKYRDGGRPFRVDPVDWYVSLARMAHRRGDRREAARILGEGLVRMGVRGTFRKLLAARHRRGDVGAVPRVGPGPEWLSRYTDAEGGSSRGGGRSA